MFTLNMEQSVRRLMVNRGFGMMETFRTRKRLIVEPEVWQKLRRVNQRSTHGSDFKRIQMRMETHETWKSYHKPPNWIGIPRTSPSGHFRLNVEIAVAISTSKYSYVFQRFFDVEISAPFRRLIENDRWACMFSLWEFLRTILKYMLPTYRIW